MKNISIKNSINTNIKYFIEKKRWRDIKTSLLKLPVQDIAEIIKNLNLNERIIVFRLIPKNIQADVFAELDFNIQEELINNFTDIQLKKIITELDPDDRTELFETLPGILLQKLLNLLPEKERKEALKLLGFPENSVGRLMTPDYVAIRPDYTVKKVLSHIRNYGIDAETINIIYVVDNNWRLIDEIPLRKIILNSPNKKIKSLMDYNVISINAYNDQEEAIKIMKKYDLISLPVVDEDGILIGIVTIDDILDVIEEENTEDFAKVSAIKTEKIGADFLTHLKDISLTKLYKSRVTWLLALLIMDLITGGIIQSFEQTIAKYVVLVTFLPVLVDTAGNAGSQSATLIIRAMAVGDIVMKDWLFLLGREFIISLALGITMGIGISIMGFVRSKSILITEVVIITMIVNVMVGSIIGVLLPFLFTKFKKDPASASTPLITTFADIIGTGIYLSIAYLFL